MSKNEWQLVSVKPEKIGMVALRIEVKSGSIIDRKIIVGHALADKFAFGADQLEGADSHSITHWLELPLIPGMDMYFREANHEQA
jgi:hypothetical protein